MKKILHGQALVELILVMGLAAIILPALLTGLVATRNGKPQQIQRTRAVTALKENEKAVVAIKNAGWSNIASYSINTDYHTVIANSQWVLQTGIFTDSNNITQKVVISDVQRDINGAIISSGGTIDPSTKKVIITITSTQPALQPLVSTLYLARTDNTSYTETTQAHFNAGVASGVSTANTIDGEVKLSAGGRGSWCGPNLNYPTVDLPKSGVANAVTAIEGKVFAGTGNNAAGVSFAKVDITNPAYPASPSATLDKTFDGYKTNGVFGETNYAYLATDSNSKEIVIIDLTQSSNGKYLEAGYFNAPGNGTGNSVFTAGSVGYMTDGSTLYTFDLSSHSGSRSQTGSYSLASTGNKVVVVGSYAYIANNTTTNQLEIVDVSNPSSPVLKKRFSVAGQAGIDVYVNSTATRAYVATAVSASQKEMFIIDISDKLNPVVKGSYEANGMSPKGVAAVTDNKVILVGTSGEEYQVIDATTETAPIHCGGLNIDTGVNGVGGVLEADGDVYSYIITGDSSSELKIIAGGAGAQYSSSGTFISQVATISATATFNRFITHVASPSATTIKVQVAGADQVSGSCTGSTYNFIGPDKTSATYFTSLDNAIISGPIPLDDDGTGYENPVRCFKYKAYLNSSDITQTPILYDMSINYTQ